MTKLIRQLAVSLLTDNHGISEESWMRLRELLMKHQSQDIVELVEATDGRFYLNESAAIVLSTLTETCYP